MGRLTRKKSFKRHDRHGNHGSSTRSEAAMFLRSLLVLAFASPAFAGGLIMTDPTAMDCKVQSNPGYAECDLSYEGNLIYEGPSRGPAEAGADCAVCKSFKAAAIKGQRHVYLDRNLGWGDNGFLTLTDDDVPPPACF
jgi:hypothetical protein